MAPVFMTGHKPTGKDVAPGQLQQLTAQMLESSGPSGMSPGGSGASGMQSRGEVGGTRAGLRGASQHLSSVPPIRLYVSAGGPLR